MSRPGSFTTSADANVGEDGTTRRTRHRDGSPHAAHPVRASVGLFLASYVVLSAIMVGLGLLVTHSLRGVTRWDVSVNRWFVHQRTGSLNALTQVGSHLAETLTVIAVALVIVIVLSVRKDRRSVVFVISAIALEVTVFLTTTLLVDRQRPPVLKLDTAPPTSSFPSGHTAASVALYLGLFLVLRHVMRPSVGRTILQLALLAMPIAVALSRMYRGMHHPTDVIAGAFLGFLCLVVAGRIASIARPTSPEGRRS